MRLEVKGTHKFLKKTEFSPLRAVIHMRAVDYVCQYGPKLWKVVQEVEAQNLPEEERVMPPLKYSLDLAKKEGHIEERKKIAHRFGHLILYPLLALALARCGHPRVLHTVSMAAKEKESGHFSNGKKYMIATQGHYSTVAGELMYQLGGNAVDAATAVSFAISVERPQSTGIGGGGFMLLKSPQNKYPEAYDFREKAPLKAHQNMFIDSEGKVIKNKSLTGIHAVGIPGMVAGVLYVHAQYGNLPLKQVLAPAIELAQKGFPVYPELAKALKLRESALKKFTAGRKIFFKNGKVLKEGEQLVQKDLAKTLQFIAQKGRKGFYQGPVAKAIIQESQFHQGLITQKDLDIYTAKKRPFVHGTYKGKDVFSMGPPSSGGIHIIQILNMVEKTNLKRYGPQHPQTVHLVASAMQQAFADRAKYLGDTDFVKVPVDRLISKKYADQMAKKIPANRAKNKNDVAPGHFPKFESNQTTHFSIMDDKGWAISSTQTLNGYFGSALAVRGTGIILNNEMDDFAAKVGASNLFGAIGGKNNLIAPGKRPLSSMSPTIIMETGRPIMTLGSPAGTRIFTCVAQTILNYFEHGLSLKDSVSSVRYHHQWSPDEIRIDAKGLPKATEKALYKMGHNLRHKNLGCRIQAITREKNQFVGVSDIRGRGMAKGK